MMNWEMPPAVPSLKRDEIHLWLIELPSQRNKIKQFEKILSLDERERASRFRSVDVYQNFVITRGKLREILASYLSTSPQNLVFNYSCNGKPSLGDLIYFNLSHSHQLTLIAFSLDTQLGVDIEWKREVVGWEQICRRFFSEAEFEQVIASRRPLEAFYDLWVKKEAYTKALGLNIFEVLRNFKQKNSHIEQQKDLYLEPILIKQEYCAALAATKKYNAVRCWLPFDSLITPA